MTSHTPSPAQPYPVHDSATSYPRVEHQLDVGAIQIVAEKFGDTGQSTTSSWLTSLE